MNLLRDLAASFSYFSILPIAHSEEPPSDGAIAFLPLVGAVIGALAGGGAYGMALVTHSQVAAAITAWLLSIAFSGAIHVDGFLDCCDGLFAMAPPEKRLEIMRDPHHGTYAIVGMAMISVLWLYALWQIPASLMPIVLAAVGFYGRYSAVIVAATWPNARGHEKLRYNVGSAMINGGVMGGVIGLTRGWVLFLVAVVVTVASSYAIGAFAARRLGGLVNGDCYGAVIVVTEVALLLAYPALALFR